MAILVRKAVYTFTHSVDTSDRRYKKRNGRTYGLYEQGGGLLTNTRCVGIWCYHGVSFKKSKHSHSLTIPLFSPLLGGSLSRPHERFPKFFGGAFWKDYPYFLPCLITSSYVAFSFVFALLYFKEVRIYIMALSLCLICFRRCQSVRNTRKRLFTTKRSRYPFASSWCTLWSSPYPITSSLPSSLLLFRLSFRCFSQRPLRLGALILIPLKLATLLDWPDLQVRFFKSCISSPSFAISARGKSSSWPFLPFFPFSFFYPWLIWLRWYLESNHLWYRRLFSSSSLVRPSRTWLLVSS